jgi:hypothetical protein
MRSSVLLLLLALTWASTQVFGGPNVAILEGFPTPDCSGPPNLPAHAADSSLVNTCMAFAPSQLYMNGHLIPGVQSWGLQCPADTFTYGLGSECNSTALPASGLCAGYTLGFSFKIRCLPDICKPDPGAQKNLCDTRAASCTEWGYPMKW